MRVLYDGTVFGLQNAGGINRYFANLVDLLPEEFLPTLTTTKRHQINFPHRLNLSVRHFPRFGFRPGRLAYWTEKLYFQYVSRGFDIIHPTYYSLLTRCPWSARSLHGKLVLTVYDFIHERFGLHDSYVVGKAAAIRAAAAILCISHHTRKDLLHLYPEIDPAKVHVTHLAADLHLGMTTGDEPVPKSPYLLYVGSRAAYKNFDGMLQAFAAVASSYPDLRLCVSGGGAFTRDEETCARRLAIYDRLQHLGTLSDSHLAKIYHNAIIFVYPSRYEGFGIPPLEAMACRVPVIAANRTSVPEVVGEAAALFDPDEPGGLENVLARLLGSSAEREKLVALGHFRAKLFDWNETVRKTVSVYREVVKN